VLVPLRLHSPMPNDIESNSLFVPDRIAPHIAEQQSNHREHA
jgi:hypothetical protein